MIREDLLEERGTHIDPQRWVEFGESDSYRWRGKSIDQKEKKSKSWD